ncbi:MAG: DUF2207 domain-containing protein, partial [Atopostipes suicloacalis]|nr:DUF2207 domain-containing protein [Atopostipes suicloacalis]
MRKWIKVFISFSFFFFYFSFHQPVSAAENEIKSIEIEVNLQEDGSAVIQEKRKMDNTKDTEIYIELSNLGESDLSSFHVEGFEEEKDWDIDASFEEKAYKYGVIEKDEGYELAWGISEYGLQNYQLSYELTNLVRNLEDGQSLFWNFDSFLSLPTEQMTLKITADFDLEDKLLKYYAFGFEEEIGINENGGFEWTGYDLTDENDVIVLLQFPENTFQASVQEDMTLSEQEEQALEGSSYNDAEAMPMVLKVILVISGLTALGLGGVGVAYAVRRGRIRKEHQHFNVHQFIGKNQNRMSKKAPELRGPYEKYSWLISELSMTGAGFSEFFFLYLLLWSEEEKIEIHSYEEERFFSDKKKATIEIKNIEAERPMNSISFEESIELFELDQSPFEEVLWGMLVELADDKGVIKGKQIEKWAEKNAESIEEIIGLLEEKSMLWLEENNYLNTFTIKDWGADIEIEQLTDKGKKVALEILSYKQFIEKLEEADLKESEDWASLMVWSVLFGLAEESIKELKELDP